jgi:hypothetical protein
MRFPSCRGPIASSESPFHARFDTEMKAGKPCGAMNCTYCPGGRGLGCLAGAAIVLGCPVGGGRIPDTARCRRLGLLPAADRNSTFCLACAFHARGAIDGCRRSPTPAISAVCDSSCILAGTALYLRLHWNAIPDRFPVHWGADGTPNGWSTRSFAGVYGPLFLGTGVVLFLSVISAVTSWGSRRSARHPAGQIVPIVVACVIAASSSAAGLLPLHMVSAGGLVAFLAASLSFLAVMIWLSLRRRAQTGAEAGEITPEVCWHGDQF